MPDSVAVIGCGPGGMFFCHALETKRKELLDRGELIDHLPRVTVFERASGPGGVWRSDRNTVSDLREEKKETEFECSVERCGTQMYEALWTNGPKEGIEFFDYTYDEHFGRQLPVYMPRHALLGYMTGRVVKNCPTFFEKYVQFNQSVSKVHYDQNAKQFSITVRDMLSGATSTQFFDKCIWAAGDNGMPFIPQSLLRIFHDFRGKIWHSSDANSFEDDVRGKQVLLVGGSYSAEDLALMACKIGVKRVYIVSRSEDNAVTWTNKWPQNRVKCMNGFSPIKVINGTQIVLRRTKYVAYDTYEVMQGDEVVLKNIDTIILCTGYCGQYGMLEPNLCGWACDSDKSRKSFPVPDDWEMLPNPVSKNIGNVPHPREGRWCGSLVVHPELYRGILIENPSMMFLRHEHEDYPILGIDAQAWLFMQFLTGGREIPSKVEMQKQNLAQALHEMKAFPYCRYVMDPTFFKLWTEDVDPDWEFYYEAEATRNKYDFMVMARTLREADHPLDIGTINGLNTLGQMLHEYGQMAYDGRQSTTTHTTFRDVQDVEEFKSIFTGTSSVPLKKPWLEIRELEEDDYF